MLVYGKYECRHADGVSCVHPVAVLNAVAVVNACRGWKRHTPEPV